MSETILTLIPMFIVILIGISVKKYVKILMPNVLRLLNNFIFYGIIPIIIFNSTCNISKTQDSNLTIVWGSALSIIIIFILCRFICDLFNIKSSLMGSINQCCIHGNLGYIGLTVVFYCLGAEKLAQCGIITAVILILQNFLVVLGFQIQSSIKLKDICLISIINGLKTNPVIISSILGISFALLGLELPIILGNVFNILTKISLPIPLFIIGTSLSIGQIHKSIVTLLIVCASKLVFLPMLSIFIFRYCCKITPNDYMPAVILLSSPVATISSIIAREMGGNYEFSSAAVSLSTLLSIVTFSMWLKLGGL